MVAAEQPCTLSGQFGRGLGAVCPWDAGINAVENLHLGHQRESLHGVRLEQLPLQVAMFLLVYVMTALISAAVGPGCV
jgi:hypothetical protein